MVNGVATILLSLVVDPTLGRLTDQCIEEQRDADDMKVVAVFLLLGILVGTLSSQLLFQPAVWVITQAAHLVIKMHTAVHQLA